MLPVYLHFQRLALDLGVGVFAVGGLVASLLAREETALALVVGDVLLEHDEDAVAIEVGDGRGGRLGGLLDLVSANHGGDVLGGDGPLVGSWEENRDTATRILGRGICEIIQILLNREDPGRGSTALRLGESFGYSMNK
jgi:hypothetical protein